MKQKIHREKFTFNWYTKNHNIIVGIQRVKRGKCSKCGLSIDSHSTLCDTCFNEEKKISKK